MFKKAIVSTPLTKEIERVHSELEVHSPDSPEYKKILEQLTGLYNCLPEKEKTLSPDAILGASVTVTMAVAILVFENRHVITTKVFGWIRPR